MLVKVQQKIMTVITMTALLRAHQEAVPINLPDLQAEVQEAVLVEAVAPVAEVNLAEAAPVAAVPVEEVNLEAAAPVAENLPVVKVQNNV